MTHRNTHNVTQNERNFVDIHRIKCGGGNMGLWSSNFRAQSNFQLKTYDQM